jgi:hypothetical protein
MTEAAFDREVESLIEWFDNHNKEKDEDFHDKAEILLQVAKANNEISNNVQKLLVMILNNAQFYQDSYNKLEDFVKKAKTVTCKCSPYGTPCSDYVSARDFLYDDEDD